MYPCPNCQKLTISPASKLWVGKPIIDGIVPERTTTCPNCSAEISVAGKNLLWLWYVIVFLSALVFWSLSGLPIASDLLRIGIGVVIGLSLSMLLFIYQLQRALIVKKK